MTRHRGQERVKVCEDCLVGEQGQVQFSWRSRKQTELGAVLGEEMGIGRARSA